MSVRLTGAEWREIQKVARKAGKPPTAWMREVVLEAAGIVVERA